MDTHPQPGDVVIIDWKKQGRQQKDEEAVYLRPFPGVSYACYVDNPRLRRHYGMSGYPVYLKNLKEGDKPEMFVPEDWS